MTPPADDDPRRPDPAGAPGRTRRGIPSLNWLRVFEAAARMESFARASESLNVSIDAQRLSGAARNFREWLLGEAAADVPASPTGASPPARRRNG